MSMPIYAIGAALYSVAQQPPTSTGYSEMFGLQYSACSSKAWITDCQQSLRLPMYTVSCSAACLVNCMFGDAHAIQAQLNSGVHTLDCSSCSVVCLM